MDRAGWGALFWLARPAGTPLVALFPFLGYAFAHWNRSLPLTNAPGMVLVGVGWALAHAGTLWLNAALDRDREPVFLGRGVQPPEWIAVPAYPAIFASIPLAAAGSPGSGVCAALCAALAVGYSHPRTRWKAHPVAGPAVNVLGYGLLSPIAGWLLVGDRVGLRPLLALPLLPLWVGGGYLAAQAFQGAEDRARGYRTFVVVRGPAATLRATRGLFALAYAWSGCLALAGFFPRVALVAWPVGWWVDRWVARWSREPDGGSVAWAHGLVVRVLAGAAWMVGVVVAEHLWLVSRGLPGAGLATAVGP